MIVVDGYELLANAVIKRAADDYTLALCKNDRSVIKECENFFLGSDIMLYTKLRGEFLMKKLRQRVVNFNYDYGAIMKDKRRWSSSVEKEGLA